MSDGLHSLLAKAADPLVAVVPIQQSSCAIRVHTSLGSRRKISQLPPALRCSSRMASSLTCGGMGRRACAQPGPAKAKGP